MTEAVIMNELTHEGNVEERAWDKGWTSTSTQWLREEGEPGEELPERRRETRSVWCAERQKAIRLQEGGVTPSPGSVQRAERKSRKRCPHPNPQNIYFHRGQKMGLQTLREGVFPGFIWMGPTPSPLSPYKGGREF